MTIKELGIRTWKFELGRLSVATPLAVLVLVLIPFARSWFSEKDLLWLFIPLVAFLLAFLITPIVRLIAIKKEIVDNPNSRKIHSEPVPLLGGLAICLAIVVSVLPNIIMSQRITLILVASSVLMVVGIVDDFHELSAVLKLLVQVAIVGVLMYFGLTLELFPQTLWGKVINMTLTVLWIVGITNAMNFIDGMDGLATGLGVTISAFLGIVAFQSGREVLGLMSLSVAGACMGFLPYNFKRDKPANIFLGDAGSTFIGFLLACLAIEGEWAENNPIVSFTAPLLIFAVLIYDMIHTTVERFRTGKVKNLKEWIDYVGRDHLHHRFESLLRSRRQSVLFIFLISICLSLNAILLIKVDTSEAILILIQAVIILCVVTILEAKGNKLDRRSD